MIKRKYDSHNHSADSLFVVLAFFMYAGCMVALICMGAMVYQSITKNMNTNNSSRTAASYLTEKVRQNDAAGAICVTELSGGSAAAGESISALEIRESFKDTEYSTYIYALGGSLRELFTRSDNEVSLDAGTKILEAEMLTFEEAEKGLIKVSLTDSEKQEHTFWLHLNSAARETEEEAAS